MIKIECIQETKRFLGLKEEWSNFLEDIHNDNIFLTFEWMSTWWRHFGSGKRLFILLARDGNRRLCGIVPFYQCLNYKEKSFKPNVFQMLGTRTSDYLDFILHPKNAVDVLDSIFLFLRKIQHWDVIQLVDFSENSSFLRYIEQSKNARIFRKNCWVKTVAPYLPLSFSWEDYLRSLNKKFRWNIRSYTRRLKRDFRNVDFCIWEDPRSIEVVMDVLAEMSKERFNKKGKKSNLNNQRFLRFHKDVASSFLKKGWLNLCCLQVENQIVAIKYGFRYSDKIFSYLASFDCSWQPQKKYNLGTVIQGLCIEDAISKGLTEYDFMRGGEAHKIRWTSFQRKNMQIQIFQNNLKGNILKLSYVLQRTIKNKIRSTLNKMNKIWLK